MKDLEQWSYAKQAAAQISAALEELGYRYSFQDELGVFELHFELRGSALRRLLLFIMVEKDFYTVCGICPVRVPKDKIHAAGEYIGRVNRRLRCGNFVLDYDTGEIRSKCGFPFKGFLPWPEVVKDSIRLPVELFEKFGDELCEVIFGDVSAKEAAQNAGDTKLA